MEKDLNHAGKKEIRNNKKPLFSEHSEELHQEEKENISDKISEERNVSGLTDRDDAPGSGINTNDPTEHTLGNP